MHMFIFLQAAVGDTQRGDQPVGGKDKRTWCLRAVQPKVTRVLVCVLCVCVCVCVREREREKGRLLPEPHNTRFCCLVGHILNSLNVQPFMFLLGGFASGAYLYIVP